MSTLLTIQALYPTYYVDNESHKNRVSPQTASAEQVLFLMRQSRGRSLWGSV
jgi:hypothetical protein